MTQQPLTAARRRLVRDLDRAATRRETGLFKAEGTKCVLDLAPCFAVEAVYATPAWASEHAGAGLTVTTATRADLERMTSLKTAPDVIAVLRRPAVEAACAEIDPAALTIALDDIQDPGNLGTIIRSSAWFGVSHIICSRSTADAYAPKVVQATMGALGRLRIDYVDDLAAVLKSSPVDVCGMFLGGDGLFTAPLPGAAVIVVGNEGHGISPSVAGAVTRRLTIPCYAAGAAESLNAAVAASITLALFRARG